MQGKPNVVALLNEALKEELTAISQYFLHAEMCENWHYSRLGESATTAMVAAGEALGSAALPDEDRRELAAAIASEGARLTRLIEKLLDLSRLEAGTAEPRRDWTSIEEVIRAAIDAIGADRDRITPSCSTTTCR